MFGVVVSVAAVLFTCFLIVHLFRGMRGDSTPIFRGLSHAKGMEQAVIARELVRGNGFSTKVIKPAAIQMFNEGKKNDEYFKHLIDGSAAFNAMTPAQQEALSPQERVKLAGTGSIPDIYHAPLNPWLNSIALRAMIGVNNIFKWHKNDQGEPDFWVFEQGELTHVADKTIAGLAVLFFFGSLVLNYLTLSWLFDRRLATITVVLLLLCQHFWDFATTGLPQLLLLFLFSGVTLCLTRAHMARTEGKWSWPWICGAAVCLGLMTLAHALSFWIVIGAAIYLGLTYRPYGLYAGVCIVLAVLLFTPWMVRNSQVCGDARGVAWATKNFQMRGTESQIMRTLTPDPDNIHPISFLNKVFGQTENQLNNIYGHLGKIPTVLFFFLALMHTFRKPETRSLRWGILLMWLFAILGMSYFGFGDYDLLASKQSNDLHIIFIPMFAAYGLALLLNLWSRVEVEGRVLSTIRVANNALTTIIITVSAFPLFSRYLSPPDSAIVFPPYYPPHLVRLGDWYTEKDVICSDMPWGVAWYADRKSLWLPMSLRDFNKLNTFDFNDRITGLLFTPVTGFRGLLSDVGAGEFSEWALFIMRDPKIRTSFPLAVTLPLPIMRASHYFLYSDRDRWTERQ